MSETEKPLAEAAAIQSILDRGVAAYRTERKQRAHWPFQARAANEAYRAVTMHVYVALDEIGMRDTAQCVELWREALNAAGFDNPAGTSAR